jgi:hypothetical protein
MQPTATINSFAFLFGTVSNSQIYLLASISSLAVIMQLVHCHITATIFSLLLAICILRPDYDNSTPTVVTATNLVLLTVYCRTTCRGNKIAAVFLLVIVQVVALAFSTMKISMVAHEARTEMMLYLLAKNQRYNPTFSHTKTPIEIFDPVLTVKQTDHLTSSARVMRYKYGVVLGYLTCAFISFCCVYRDVQRADNIHPNEQQLEKSLFRIFYVVNSFLHLAVAFYVVLCMISC